MVFDWQTIAATSAPWAIVVALLIYLFKNPEKAEKWGSIVARIFSFTSDRLEKKSVAGDIQSDINSFAKEVNSQTKDPIVPYKVKVKWISSTTPFSFIERRQVIVRMRHHKNQAKNFLYATMQWVSKGLIPESRHLIDRRVLRAAELVFVNNLLSEKKRHDVKQLFYDEIYELEATKGSILEQYCNTFDKLNETGIFTGVVLPEFSSLGKRLGLTIAREKPRTESVGFMRMLEKLAKKRSREDVNPTYDGENIRCSIVLIAKPETYLAYGLAPYTKWINKCVENGIRSFYVCAIDDANIMVVRKIRDAYEASKKINVVSENTFKVKGGRKAIVLTLELTSGRPIS